jgi:hypothetical protein
MSTDRRPAAPRPRAQTQHREPAQEGDRYSLVDQGRLSVPMPVPAKGYRPAVVDTPIPESHGPRSMSPAPWERESVVTAARVELERHGDRLVAPKPSTPPPKSVYDEASKPYRQPPFWESAEGWVKFFGGLGALSVTIGGVYATVRATAPKTEPATILVSCPPLKADASEEERSKQPDVCRRIDKLSADVDRAYRLIDTIEADRARERLLKEQAAAATITARPPK